jgi:hypothetical protein
MPDGVLILHLSGASAPTGQFPPPLKKLSFLKYTGLCGTDTRFPDKYVAQAVMQFPHHTPLFRRKVEHRAIKEPI